MPVYSHLTYDIVPGRFQVVDQPDVLIVEGLTILQTGPPPGAPAPRVFASDFFDFTIYVDADPAHIRRWYIERFLALRGTAFRDPASYFRRYATLDDAEAVAVAERIWGRSTSAICSRTFFRRGSAPISSWRRDTITPSGACASASHEIGVIRGSRSSSPATCRSCGS